MNLGGPLTVPKALLFGVVGLTLFFLILPIFIVIPISFSTSFTLKFPPPGYSLQWFEGYFTSPRWMDATWNSFHVAIFTVLVSVPLGSLAAFGLVRGSFPGKRILNSFFLIPIIIPHLVIAIAMYKLFSKLGLTGSLTGFVIGHSMLAIPFVITIMTAVLRGIDVNLENAARVHGASRLRSIWHVTFPLALPGVISSALFAFLVSFDELMIALFLSSPTMTTLPKRLWDGIRMEMDPTLGAVATFLVVVSMVVLGLAAVTKHAMVRRTH